MEARTRFVDEQVITAVGHGTRQIVIAGAGYDDRALRFAHPGVRYFELDHPETQADKHARLLDMSSDLSGLSFVPADFRFDDVGSALSGAGHEAGLPTLFICEGLLVYLEVADIVSLLAGFYRRAASGSILAASLAVHPAGYDSGAFRDEANRRRPNAATEPWRTILPLADHLDVVRRSGWEPVSALDDSSFGTGAAPDRSAMMVAVPAGPATS